MTSVFSWMEMGVAGNRCEISGCYTVDEWICWQEAVETMSVIWIWQRSFYVDGCRLSAVVCWDVRVGGWPLRRSCKPLYRHIFDETCNLNWPFVCAVKINLPTVRHIRWTLMYTFLFTGCALVFGVLNDPCEIKINRKTISASTACWKLG